MMRWRTCILAACCLIAVLGMLRRSARVTAAATQPTAAAPSVTFTRDIAPLVYANCVSCHRPGEAAPFALISFSDVHKRAAQIVSVTARRYMPPWKPQPGWGHFQGERRLSDGQIKLLADWAAVGAPQGDPADLPAVPTFAQGWQLGQPDLVLRMSTPFTVAPDGNHGRDVYRAFVLPLNLETDRYVTAVEFRPDDRPVVHHALFFLDSTGAARRKEKAETDGQPGYGTFGGPGFAPTGGLGGWAPGAVPAPLPAGWARLARAGSDLVVQFHFHPTGKTEVEQAQIGLYFAKETPSRIVGPANAHSFRINIAPGEKQYVVTGKYTVPVDLDVVGLTPHAHLLCKDMKAWATLPDGSEQKLIWIDDWDFNWQGQYRLVSPLRLPAGTVVQMRYTYDNSADNLRNPSNPPKRVHYGEQTTDEMAFLFMDVSPVNATDWPALRHGNRRQMIDALTRFTGANQN